MDTTDCIRAESGRTHEAKIQQFGDIENVTALCQKDVAGLYITVYETAAVSFVQSAAKLSQNMDHTCRRLRPELLDQLPQI